jgi:hypothetical protein
MDVNRSLRRRRESATCYRPLDLGWNSWSEEPRPVDLPFVAVDDFRAEGGDFGCVTRSASAAAGTPAAAFPLLWIAESAYTETRSSSVILVR